MLDFLKEEIQVGEKGNSPTHLKERSGSRSAGKNYTITSMTAHELLMTANTSHAGVKTAPASCRICAFCRKNHSSCQCAVISDITARKAFLVAHSDCFNCLNIRHILRDCDSTT